MLFSLLFFFPFSFLFLSSLSFSFSFLFFPYSLTSILITLFLFSMAHTHTFIPTLFHTHLRLHFSIPIYIHLDWLGGYLSIYTLSFFINYVNYYCYFLCYITTFFHKDLITVKTFMSVNLPLHFNYIISIIILLL